MLLGMSKNALGFNLHVSAAPVSHSNIYQQLAEDLKQVRGHCKSRCTYRKGQRSQWATQITHFGAGHFGPGAKAPLYESIPLDQLMLQDCSYSSCISQGRSSHCLQLFLANWNSTGASVTIQMDGKWTTVGKKDTRKEKQRSDPKSEDAPNQPDAASQSAFASLDIDWKKQQGGTTLLLIRLGSDTVCNCLCR